MDVWMWSRFCREWWHPMWETWACSGLDHCLRIYVLLLIRTQAFRSTSGERMRWKGSYLVQASIWNILINRATSTMFKPCPMDICGIWLHQVQAKRGGGGEKSGRKRVKREWVSRWKRKSERRRRRRKYSCMKGKWGWMCGWVVFLLLSRDLRVIDNQQTLLQMSYAVESNKRPRTVSSSS